MEVRSGECTPGPPFSKRCATSAFSPVRTPFSSAAAASTFKTLTAVSSTLQATRGGASKAAFLERALAHHLWLRGLALCIALGAAPLVLWTAATFSAVVSSLPSSATEALAPAGATVAAASSDARMALLALLVVVFGGIGAQGAFGWIAEANRALLVPRTRRQLRLVRFGAASFVALECATVAFSDSHAYKYPLAVVVIVLVARDRFFGMAWQPIAAALLLGGAAMAGLVRLTADVFFHATEAQRLGLRLLVHPLLVEACIAPLRHVGSGIGSRRGAGPIQLLCGGFAVMGAVSGRLQAAHMLSDGGTVAVVAGMCGLEALHRATVLRRDEFYCRALHRVRARHGGALEVTAAVALADGLAEDVGILLAPVLTLAFRLGRPAWAALALQWLAKLAVDLAPAFSGAAAVAPPGAPPTAARLSFEAGDELRRDGRRRGLLALVFVAWALVLVRAVFFPLQSFCATDPQPSPVGRLEWWAWSLCR